MSRGGKCLLAGLNAVLCYYCIITGPANPLTAVVVGITVVMIVQAIQPKD